MKIKVSDYIANFLVEQRIDHLFSVVGGGSMFLNDSFGHKDGLKVTYHHHEQAAAMAGEAFARTKLHPSAVCVTSGPGGTNALTGCLCAYTGSIPVLFFSGQVRYTTSVPSTGLKIRQMGFQEFQIVDVVKHMTKYATMIVYAENIRYHLEKALFFATHGRPGPVWLDIPLDVQNAIVETDSLQKFEDKKIAKECPSPVSSDVVDRIYRKIKNSERPIVLLGKGLRFSGGLERLKDFVHALKIPVVTGMSSVDAMETDDFVFIGRSGITGDRAGNFAVQNSDLLLSIGNRLSFSQIGYNYQSWAREAFKIAVDIDPEELRKPVLEINFPVCADANDFINKLDDRRQIDERPNVFDKWLRRCQKWKTHYPVVLPKHHAEKNRVNIYAFFDILYDFLKPNDVLIVSAGTARVVGAQTAVIKKGQRFISNSSTASMGYGLPAAIGACLAKEHAPVICVTGDGSFQMNIQELQTIRHNHLPIKIFVINNEGYHSIRMTQNAYFPDRSYVGIGNDSGDLSFPDLSKLSLAYGFPYYFCKENTNLESVINNCFKKKGYLICEVFVSKDQAVEPKAASKKKEDGRFISAPLEEMAPFLEKDELKKNMIIDLLDP